MIELKIFLLFYINRVDRCTSIGVDPPAALIVQLKESHESHSPDPDPR
jgi:hypothetical protein